jgi:hypothetical protein
VEERVPIRIGVAGVVIMIGEARDPAVVVAVTSRDLITTGILQTGLTARRNEPA